MMQRSYNAQIGRAVASVRENARITQDELGKRISTSAARISRFETGVAELTDEELSMLLEAIGSDEALSLKNHLQEEWREIEKPYFEHPSREALKCIDSARQMLRALKDDPETNTLFIKHVEEYERELSRLEHDLRSVDHNIAFVGSNGIGKSTAICMLADLRISADQAPNKQMVLEVGAGGTTVCEVHVKTGPAYGLIVEPRSMDAIRQDVIDFAVDILQVPDSNLVEEEPGAEGIPVISKELDRAIRNMADLVETKSKDPETGRPMWDDPACKLAQHYSSVRELTTQILMRMNLEERLRRDIWYSEEIGANALEWLQRTFADINNGRHPQFSLPSRIDVIVPRPVLGDGRLDLRLIDTKGIFGTVSRADIDRLFDDRRTVVVLCSGFNNAPAVELQQLLQRAKDAGVSNIADKTAILVLARPEEATAVKDNRGRVVDSELEGYELKGFDVETHLERLRIGSIATIFYNARNDDAGSIREILLEKAIQIRESWTRQAIAINKTIEQLVENHRQERTATSYRQVMKRLQIWLLNNKQIENLSELPQSTLIRSIRTAHPRTIGASVRRKGEWNNLDYYYQTGFGVRTLAAKHILKKTEEFEVIIQNLLDDQSLAAAHSLLEQIKRVLRNKSDEVLKQMEIVGKALYQDELKSDNAFWGDLELEHGAGYRERIAKKSDNWFDSDTQEAKRIAVMNKVVDGWKEILSAVEKLVAHVAE